MDYVCIMFTKSDNCNGSDIVWQVCETQVFGRFQDRIILEEGKARTYEAAALQMAESARKLTGHK